MQKFVTIAIDTTQLNPGKVNAFAVNEVEEINDLLELGWQVEEWDFLKEGEADGQVVLMVILNDEDMFKDEEDDFDMEFEAEDDEYESEEDDREEALKN